MKPIIEESDVEGFAVFTSQATDSGGLTFGQVLVQRAKDRASRRASCLDWCSGTGAIGFAYLGRGACDQLTIFDVNEEARDLARRTIELHGLEDTVLPESPFDMVLGSPPHVNAATPQSAIGKIRPALTWSDWIGLCIGTSMHRSDGY
jgi:tRNA1(Val) A37 N6-methylase TrmN6